MQPIKQDIIARLYTQYNGKAVSFSGLYDGTAGSITVGFDDNISITVPFDYRSLDGPDQGKMDVFMHVISQAAAVAIIKHTVLNSNRNFFIVMVSESGIIEPSIIDSLQSLFNTHRLTLAGNYDGLNGTMHVYFTNATYNVNFSYIGDVVNSFIEICTRAVAYAISLYNVTEPASLYSIVTNDYPTKQTEFTVDLPQQDLWATYTLYSEVYRDI